jgi:NAD(P)H-nitrite reductase large subunit
MADAPKGSFIQRDGKTYAIVPRTPMGLITPDTLEKIAAVARKYDIPVIKITSAQRMALVGIPPEQIEPIWQDLGIDVGHAVEACMHYVQACPGNNFCRFGVQDSLALGGKLEKKFYEFELPAKTKIGVSGCPFNCAESYMRDLGVFGKKSGWTVTFGGNAGSRPRIGDIIATKLSDDEVIDLAQRCFTYYRDNSGPKKRTARMIEKIGIEEFKKAVLG